MEKRLKISALITLFNLVLGCAISDESGVRKNICTSDWYSLVEKQVPTGDGRGHGPDLGSSEWRSVVEFKLGIRGNPYIPPRHTDQWCDYIDKYYIQLRT